MWREVGRLAKDLCNRGSHGNDEQIIGRRFDWRHIDKTLDGNGVTGACQRV
jgi:hypothetical protein